MSEARRYSDRLRAGLGHIGGRPKGFIPIAADDNPDGSWLRRLMYGKNKCLARIDRTAQDSFPRCIVTETQCCGRFVRGDNYMREAALDEGLWHHEELDPATCGAGSSSNWTLATM